MTMDFAFDINIIISIAAAIAAFILFMIVVTVTSKESTAKRLKRLAPTKEEAADYVGQTREYRSGGLAADLEPILRILGLRPDEFRRIHFFKFYRAGVDPVDGPIYYLAWKFFLTPIAFIAVYYMMTHMGDNTLQKLQYVLVSIILVAVTWFGGDLYLSNKRAKREKILMRSFPDGLDLLLVCTESGLALDGALARVTRELGHAHPELTEELNKTRMELTLLNDRERALSNLAERVDLVPVRSLVAALLQTERFGTSLTDTLRVLADEYRTTRLMLAEQKAGRLPVIMTVPLILLMMPAFLMIVMGPAAISAMKAW
jgi:tight adherence protein C